MASKQPEPLLRTPEDQLNKVEKYKLQSNGLRNDLEAQFRDFNVGQVSDEAEQIAKSHGIYLEYNRALTGREKDWMYMIRVSIPGGGSLNAQQWRILDEAADQFAGGNPYGGTSLRLTTRQNVQFHWVRKPELIQLIQHIARTGYFSLNGCGDNVRNVMGCPLSKYSDIYNANAKAHEYGRYFQLPSAPHIQVFAIDPNAFRDMDNGPKYEYGQRLLNRKFKIAFSAVQRNEQGNVVYDNCVELRTNDLGIAPLIENEKVAGYVVYVGGGQGEKNGKPTFAALSQPLGIFTEADLMHGLKSVVDVHKEWGDRRNRHWARLKYVVHKQGIDWYRQQVRDKGGVFELPDPDFDPGPRMMHHGWQTLPTTGKLAYGAYIENGRLIDSVDVREDAAHQSGNVTGNGRLKSMVRGVFDAFPDTEVMITPNQDLLFADIEPDAKEDFEAKLREYGFGKRRGKGYSTLRVLSGACVGLPTCRLSYTDSEQFEPELIDQLDDMGYGDMNESIGITGCERQCFRPATKSIGWVGQGPDMYGLKLGGSEDGRHQGQWLVHEDKWHLRQVPRDHVAVVTAALFDHYKANRENGEDLGAFYRRIGNKAVIDHLGSLDKTKHLLEKTPAAPYIPEPVTAEAK